MLAKYARIQMLGMACNAELIVQLYDAGAAVEVCTPLIVERRADRRKPTPVLFELGMCKFAPSQGGFHKVVASDRAAYALTAALRTAKLEAELLPLLRAHPGWRPTEFLNYTPIRHIAIVLGRMIDPRWYVDVCYPDRPNKFYESLGLNYFTQRSVTGPNYPKRNPRHNAICDRVLHCWKNENYEHEVKALFELAGNKPRADAIKLGIRPCDFCWRVWGQHEDPVRADLRGSQRFADFLRQTWLSEIYRASPATPEERAGLFRPADFFKYDEEVQAYEVFAAKTLITK
jgi:hypothetical protein